MRRSKTILNLHKRASWQLHLFKDWWGTRVWERTTEVITPLGFKFVSGFHPAYQLMREGKFEIEETAIINRFLSQIDVFVDVGANLGYYTCLASKHGKHVIAFEPQQQNLRSLTNNLIVNGYQELVEVFPLALSEKSGLLTLYGASGPSASLVKGWAGYSSNYRQTIPVSTLDNVLGGRFLDKQLFVKIDVEGAEYQVLRGGQDTLSRDQKPVWLLEVCLREFDPSGLNPHYKETFELFWDYGYQAYTATEPTQLVTRQDISDWIDKESSGYRTFNYIFVGADMALLNFSKQIGKNIVQQKGSI